MHKILLLSLKATSIIYSADQHNNELRIPIYFAHASGINYLAYEYHVIPTENLRFKDLANDIKEQYSIDGALIFLSNGSRIPFIATNNLGMPSRLNPGSYNLSFYTATIVHYDQRRAS